MTSEKKGTKKNSEKPKGQKGVVIERGKELADPWIAKEVLKKIDGEKEKREVKDNGRWKAWWGDEHAGEKCNAGRVIGYKYVDRAGKELGGYRIDWEPPALVREKQEKELVFDGSTGEDSLKEVNEKDSVVAPKRAHYNLNLFLVGKEEGYFLRIETTEADEALMYEVEQPVVSGECTAEEAEEGIRRFSLTKGIAAGDGNVRMASFRWTLAEMERLISSNEEIPKEATDLIKKMQQDSIAIKLYRAFAPDGLYEKVIVAANSGIEVSRRFKAAEDEDPSAQNAIGEHHQNGQHGLPLDEKKAVYWYKKAAEQKFAAAQRNLAICHNKGLGGLTVNPVEAAKQFRLSADQGDAVAQRNLAGFYLTGSRSLKKDKDKAIRWLTLAAPKDKKAQELLTQLAEKEETKAQNALKVPSTMTPGDTSSDSSITEGAADPKTLAAAISLTDAPLGGLDQYTQYTVFPKKGVNSAIDTNTPSSPALKAVSQQGFFPPPVDKPAEKNSVAGDYIFDESDLIPGFRRRKDNGPGRHKL